MIIGGNKKMNEIIRIRDELIKIRVIMDTDIPKSKQKITNLISELLKQIEG